LSFEAALRASLFIIKIEIGLHSAPGQNPVSLALTSPADIPRECKISLMLTTNP